MSAALVLFRHRIGMPVPSHGGPAASIRYSLRLNDIELVSESNRVLWERRNKPHEIPPSVVSLMARLERALGVTAIRVTEKERS